MTSARGAVAIPYDAVVRVVAARMLRTRWDALVAVALVGLSFVPGVAQQGLELAHASDRPIDALGIGLTVIQGGGIALLRRRPTISLALVGVAFGAYQLLGYPTTFAALGLLVALVGAGGLIERHRRLTAAIALASYVSLAAVLVIVEGRLSGTDALVFGILLTLLWILGSWLRAQAALRLRNAERAEQDAIATERARIARDLHDVVTHHVTAIVVQAEAGQYQRDLDDATRALLASLADGGRAALVDLRSLLGALEGDAEETRRPALEKAVDVVEGARATGQQIELTEHGTPRRLAGAPGLAVIRVMQESITNARKHASDHPVSVAITYTDDEVMVTVTSYGRGDRTATAVGGRGIIGMRERVELIGGELHAGPMGRRFVVRARIPA